MESREIESHDLNESFLRVIHSWNIEQQFGMRHKVGDPLKHALGLQNECRQGDSGQVHAWAELRDHTQQDVLYVHHLVQCLSRGTCLDKPCSRPPIAQHSHYHPPFWRHLDAILAYTRQVWAPVEECHVERHPRVANETKNVKGGMLESQGGRERVYLARDFSFCKLKGSTAQKIHVKCRRNPQDREDWILKVEFANRSR